MAAYDSATEQVATALVAPASLGKRLYYVQGRDASGAVGTMRAAQVEVLDPAQNASVSGTVTSVAGVPLAATVEANLLATRSRTDSGAYLHRLPPGNYTITASAPHFESATLAGLALAAGSSATRDFSLYALCPRLAETAEDGVGGWTTQVAAGAYTWGIATALGAGATRGWTESPAGNYGNNIDTSLVSPSIDLAGHASPVLRFDSYCDTERGYDYGRVEVRTGPAAAWTEVHRCDGDPAWRRVELALPMLAGAGQAQLRFRTTSDSSQVAAGWVIDNLLLEAGGEACRATQFAGAPSVPDLAADRDTGASDSDNITHAALLRFTGSCTAGDRSSHWSAARPAARPRPARPAATTSNWCWPRPTRIRSRCARSVARRRRRPARRCWSRSTARRRPRPRSPGQPTRPRPRSWSRERWRKMRAASRSRSTASPGARPRR